jgi:hypothetical protein
MCSNAKSAKVSGNCITSADIGPSDNSLQFHVRVEGPRAQLLQPDVLIDENAAPLYVQNFSVKRCPVFLDRDHRKVEDECGSNEIACSPIEPVELLI